MSMQDQTAGLVWFDASDRERASIEGLIRSAMRLVMPGRLICAVWDVGTGWHPTPPVEAWVAREGLGSPADRSEDGAEPFLYFGHLAVRHYADDHFDPVATTNCLLLRRAGSPAYRRRGDSAAPQAEDRLDSTDPVFTRDVCNSVWHLRIDTDRYAGVIGRLARLTCWSDEPIVEVTPEGCIDRGEWRTYRNGDLVPVPSRVAYVWTPLADIMAVQPALLDF